MDITDIAVIAGRGEVKEVLGSDANTYPEPLGLACINLPVVSLP